MNAFRSQFQWKNAKFPQDYDGSFALCRWQSSCQISGWFILYRLLLALLFICVILSSVLIDNWTLWPIFLTNLGYIGLTVHLVISAAVVIEQLLNQCYGNSNSVRLTLLTRISWVFYNVTNTVTIVITAVFWTAIYEPDNGLTRYDFLFHILNSVVVLMDVVVSGRPFFLLHIYQPLSALFCYFIFTLIYWASGGVGPHGFPWIYPVVNWTQPGPTIFFLFIISLLLIPLQVFLWGLHFLSDFLHNKLRNS